MNNCSFMQKSNQRDSSLMDINIKMDKATWSFISRIRKMKVLKKPEIWYSQFSQAEMFDPFKKLLASRNFELNIILDIWPS